MGLPAQAKWKLYDYRYRGEDPRANELTVDFQHNSGTLKYKYETLPLNTITKTTPTHFGAKFSRGGYQGILDAEVNGDDVYLEIFGLRDLTGAAIKACYQGTPISFTPMPDQDASLTPKQRALALVQAFGQRTGRGVFPNISRQAVASDLRSRIENPDSLDQAQSSFCGPAAFMFCYLDDPIAYTKYVTELYDNGQAHIGSMLIRPSAGFRFDPLPEDSRAADWIALGSLRDSENWFFEYHRAELPFLNARADIEWVEEMRGGTSTSDMLSWFSRAGYTKVEDFTGEDLPMSKARLATEYYNKNYRVCLSICSNMLDQKTVNNSNFAADHWVVLTSPITVGGDQVSFTIYTWANKNWAVKVKPEQFSKNFYGFIAAGR